ncbi:MAG: malto-oligosyltrehalose synthase [Bacteroidales bacterium]
MYNPISTYRLQFHKQFRFEDADKLVAYLHKLGIGTIYASPILEAVEGSAHGYDGINPNAINPKIGTRAELEHLCEKLKKNQIGWLQDIVPNHLAYDTSNPWLADVLEKGRQSPFAEYFDIRWSDNEPLMVPFLGTDLDTALADGIITIVCKQGQLFVSVYNQNYPVNPALYHNILQDNSANIHPKLQKLLADIHECAGGKITPQLWESYTQKLSVISSESEIQDYIKSRLEKINTTPHLLRKILHEQTYELCYWQHTHEKINYRRFFTVNGLMCLNIHIKKVFDAYHRTIMELIKKDIFQGLRIDHVDGLYDPTEYLERLRETAGKESYVIVEKILEHTEKIPDNWPVQGESGYAFLATVNNVLTNSRSKKEFTEFYYTRISNEKAPVAEQIKSKKEFILYKRMAGELENLLTDLKHAIKTLHRDVSIDSDSMKKAIGDFLIQFPVYRFYGRKMPLPAEEASAISDIFDSMPQPREESHDATLMLKQLLLEETQGNNHTFNERMLHFYRRVMQITGPLMAKGVEDTLMYSYNRFVGHNEVGDSLEVYGIDADEWHNKMRERMALHPLTMNTTSTHDTKRGEDVRARLNVISDIPKLWFEQVEKFQDMNHHLKTNNSPDLNDEYFIYFTLFGMYPMPGQPDEDVAERIQNYIPKALREAKTHTNWTDNDETYEKNVTNFACSLLDKSKPFWKAFTSLHATISDFGIINSISQLILKCTSPGLPDIYQGTELWDLTLVDPDNRRPVNYDARIQLLDEISALQKDKARTLKNVLWENRYTGTIKLWLTQLLLSYRKAQPDVFLHGDYIALETTGTYKNNVLAYARKHKGTWLLVLVPLHMPDVCSGNKKTIRTCNWKDTAVIIPPHAPKQWNDLTDTTHTVNATILSDNKSSIAVEKLFQDLPMAIMEGRKKETGRKAGILMHISSLPGKFGTGDMGPEAYSFANFLCNSGQKYWQVLPLNPTDEKNGYSPYGSTSAMAGNILLISPEKLVEHGLLPADEIKNTHIGNEGKACFTEAHELKNRILSITWNRFQRHECPDHTQSFNDFCTRESYWLDDYSMYVVLKDLHKGLPWHKWSPEYKKRKKNALDALRNDYADSLSKVKWFQYIFSMQWQELRNYCKQHDIELFGDMPIYMSQDSVDVWTHPHIFNIDKEGAPRTVAGVPPDYFNEDGQLWGMPVFNWEALKKTGYAWWKNRIRKNLELFDLIRLDHFRAFSAYWSVPAHHTTAKNGTWMPGPGMDLFDALKKEFGTLPFVAEDLGDIDEQVHALRHKTGMPGMKVLQFAFGDSMPLSENIPHNFTRDSFVYTGTHDNNTTAGWYGKETSVADRERLTKYSGRTVNAQNVHSVLIQLAYASVSETAIIPMQDALGLGEDAVMNIPGCSKGNWTWRIKRGITDSEISAYLYGMAQTYGRV